ncbi:biliverdin-producing heme oxygenase [Lutibaculum baratangense]|uniref:Bacteriophytochrome heme oxygenase BphO n=1 Tax=Lutibaculum baratangense AMV1 TaxID=631454 RepID=V4REQ5_9HYPH|nr:biliverdin-producing heme oxygenase [Lutibaculum baratangense]ESR23859.1 bacteriophytochrome heme oxygenase BphO [Lutibaculum baratangense AMV1]
MIPEAPPGVGSPLPAPSLLHDLRAATRFHHRDLEDDLSLTSRALTRDSYAQLLGLFYGFHRMHEPMLDRLFAGDEFWPPRRRLEPIVHDLRLLGRTETDLTDLPCAEVPPIGSRAGGLGCLYVFEGATLGGQVIARHLACSGDLPREAKSYFAGRGRRAGPMWRDTCAILEREVAPGDRPEAVAAACAVFSALHAWLAPFIEAGRVGT